jgi:hypothetical protein
MKINTFKERESCKHTDKLKDYRKCCSICKDVADEDLLNKYLEATTTEEAYQLNKKP